MSSSPSRGRPLRPHDPQRCRAISTGTRPSAVSTRVRSRPPTSARGAAAASRRRTTGIRPSPSRRPRKPRPAPRASPPPPPRATCRPPAPDAARRRRPTPATPARTSPTPTSTPAPPTRTTRTRRPCFSPPLPPQSLSPCGPPAFGCLENPKSNGPRGSNPTHLPRPTVARIRHHAGSICPRTATRTKPHDRTTAIAHNLWYTLPSRRFRKATAGSP